MSACFKDVSFEFRLIVAQDTCIKVYTAANDSCSVTQIQEASQHTISAQDFLFTDK